LLLAARRIIVARHARFLSLRSWKRRLPRSPSSLPYSHVETTQKPEVTLRTVIATARACAAWSSFRNHELIGAAARLLAYQLVPARPRFCLEAHIARNGACWLMSRRGTRRRLTRSSGPALSSQLYQSIRPTIVRLPPFAPVHSQPLRLLPKRLFISASLPLVPTSRPPLHCPNAYFIPQVSIESLQS